MKIRENIFCVLVITIISLLGNSNAQEINLSPKVILPSEIKWNSSSTQNYAIETFNLIGNPSEKSYYVQLVKIPSNVKLLPHFHPDNRTVYVVSGFFYYCYEKIFDESKAKKFPAGTFFTEPANQPHFAFTKESEVILYVSGFGPSKTTFIEGSKN